LNDRQMNKKASTESVNPGARRSGP
jgi:hypothetical protein